MKEDKDDVLLSVKETTPSVDSSKSGENVTEKGKIEGVLSEKDEGEDVVVDVVGADDHGGTKVVDLEGKVAFNGSVEEGSVTRDQVMEDVSVVEEACDGSDGRKVVSSEKVEVVVKASEENLVTKVDSEPLIGATESGSTNEIVEQPKESVQEVADEDEVMGEKTENKIEDLNSTKVPEGDVVVEEEGVVGHEKSEDGVKIDSLSTVTGEDAKDDDQRAGVDQTSTESLQPTTEDTKNDARKSVNETQVEDSKMAAEETQLVAEETAIKEDVSEEKVEQPVESVQEVANVDRVMNEETGKDVVLDLKNVSDSVTKVDVVSEDPSSKCPDNVVLSCEAIDIKTSEVEVDQTTKEEISDLNIEAKTDTVEEFGKEAGVEDSKIEGEIAVIDKKEEPEVISPNEKAAKEDEPLTVVNPGPEEADVAVVSVNVEISDQKVEVDSVSKGNEVCDSGENIDVAEVKESNLQAVDEIPKTEEVTPVPVVPNSEVQVSTADAIIVEALEEKVDSIQSSTIGDTNNFQEDQGLKVEDLNKISISAGEMKVPEASVEHFDQVNHEPPHGTYTEEDAGMDIDEVLGWKDEIQPIVNEDIKETDFCQNQETESLIPEVDQSTYSDDIIDDEASISLHQTTYFHPPENEGEFAVSDLVWGKVRSHPWWPGQIFDPSDASEKAMKYHKKDCFLVAYFGDRTFAWNDSTVLKPFRAKFSQIEKHSSSEAFNNAVQCALEEVSRRVELGLACSCVSQEIYEKIQFQAVENAGIRQESSKRYGVDKSANVSSFEPDKLVDYVRQLAKFPYNEGDKLELTMAKAQLSSYVRYKGYRQLSEFRSSGDLLEDALVLPEVTVEGQEGNLASSPTSKKRKAFDSVSDTSEKRPALQTKTLTAKPSFKVGELIQRVASQLTGTDKPVDSVDQPVDPQPNLPDMLSQLHLAAQDPMKEHTFLNTIIPFFHTHRSNAVIKSKKENDNRKRKPSNENDPEDFEFDDVNDSYWTDRIIQNYPEEQENTNNNTQNGGGEQQQHQQQQQIVAYEQNNNNNNNNNKVVMKASRRSNKKRYFSSNYEIEAKEQSELIERRRQNLATEVLMKYTEGIYFPSEIQLNKMFKRFGPLMESETEVDRQSGRARVVFKKCSDAEVAHSSAGKFNIFGSISVKYELNYTPLISYKPLPLPMAQDPTDAC